MLQHLPARLEMEAGQLLVPYPLIGKAMRQVLFVWQPMPLIPLY